MAEVTKDQAQMPEHSVLTPYFMYAVVYNTQIYITCSPCVLQQVTVNGSQEKAHINRHNVSLSLGASRPFNNMYVCDHVQLHTIDTNECLSTDSVYSVYIMYIYMYMYEYLSCVM